MSEPRLNLVMPETAAPAPRELELIVTTDDTDFPHSVLKVALTKYLEKFLDYGFDEETEEEVKKDITKFLNRMVKTSAIVEIEDYSEGHISVSFSLMHDLK